MSSKQTAPVIKDDVISSLPKRRQHLIALFFIIVLPFIMFNTVTLGGKQFMGHDTIEWRAGAESVFQYRATHGGEEPLWATNMFSGMPAYVVSVQKSVPHIDELVRTLSNSIYPAAHYWILMAGVYILFILMGMGPLTSLLGAICISFTTYVPIIIGAGHNTKFIAFVFIPWVLIGYWLMTRRPKKLLSFAVFVIALTLEFRAGHPQVTYYFFYLIGFWWLYDTWQAYREKRIKPWLQTTGLLALAGVIGLLGNAQQYWRFIEYSPYSIRGGSALSQGSGGLDMQYAFGWSQGFGELLTLIIPGIYGGSSSEAYWGPKPVTSGPHYLGVVAFILALIGLFQSKNKLKYLFAGVGTLTLLFSLGNHFAVFNGLMFEYAPYFDKFRTPEMWLMVTVFCYSIIAVFGIEVLINMAISKKDQLKQLYTPLGTALTIGLLFTVGSNALLSFEKPGERQQYARQIAQQNNVNLSDQRVQQAVSNYINSKLKPKRKEMAKSDSIRYFVICLIVAGLILGFYKRKVGLGLFLLGLCVVASYDYISVGGRYLNEQNTVDESFNPQQVIERQRRPIDTFLQKHAQTDRAYPWRVFPLQDNPFNNAVPAYFYPSIGGYSGAKLSYYQDLIDNLLFTKQGGLSIPILNMLNVKYISYNQSIPSKGLKQVYSGKDGYVFENTQALSKAFYADSLVYASSASQAMDYLKSAGHFKADHTAVVEHASGLKATADTSATAKITHYNARNIKIETTRNSPGYLVLSEIYYPKGWEATIDDKPTEIYKTDYVLRGMQVPAGKHEINLEFNPHSYVWGSRVAWASNILQWGLGLFALVLWFRERKEEENIE